MQRFEHYSAPNIPAANVIEIRIRLSILFEMRDRTTEAFGDAAIYHT